MLFNQHSYLVSSAFLLGLILWLVLRQGFSWGGLAAVVVTAGALAGMWLATRTGASTYDEVARVERALTEGPTLVEFYSNY